jgi:capsule polysaccharide export protein KpsE/RkpR
MRNGINIVLVIVGLVLLFYGLQASESFASSVSEFFSGTPTDHSMWLMIGGIACAALGLFGLIREPRAAR